jgi:ribonucleoside-diphosphate reductase alpha chain
LNVSDGDKAKATGTGKSKDTELALAAALSETANATAALAQSETRIAALEQELAKLRTLAAAVVSATVVTPGPAGPQEHQAPPKAVRHRLPDERASLTHKFSIGGHEGYITVGLYPNGQPGEIFIKMAKEGSTVSGLMDSFATATSLALQHGVPLKVLCEKFAHSRFEPSGWTGSETLGYAKSIMDYLFRWLELRFLSGVQLPLFSPSGAEGRSAQPPASLAIPVAGTLSETGVRYAAPNAAAPGPAPDDRSRYHAADAMRSLYDMGDAPSCQTCGAIMVRSGSCYRCMSCGSTSGCS